MKIVEFRTQLPFTMEEFPLGQLYMVAKASRENSAGGDGVETVKNEPYEKDGVKGQYTYKRLYFANRIPKWLQKILPKDSMVLEEESWNAFPYTKTVYKNKWMKDDFSLTIESMHVPGAEPVENALNLTADELKKRKVEVIDLGVKVKSNTKEYKCNVDPTVFHSEKTGRGPLTPKWWEKAGEKGWPVMTAYKVMKFHFKWFGLQTIAESYSVSVCRTFFGNAHRQQVCWMDEYHGMTIEDIRAFEAQQQAEAMKGLKEPPKENPDENDEDEQEPSSSATPSCSATPNSGEKAPTPSGSTSPSPSSSSSTAQPDSEQPSDADDAAKKQTEEGKEEKKEEEKKD